MQTKYSKCGKRRCEMMDFPLCKYFDLLNLLSFVIFVLQIENYRHETFVIVTCFYINGVCKYRS